MLTYYEDKVCPLCKREFKALVDISGTQIDMRLDLKPIGPISAPLLVPVCPNCKFVIYDDIIVEDEVLQCKGIIESDEYQQHSERASYYLFGLLFQKLGKNELNVAHLFLKASWQEEEDETYYKEDLELSLNYFEKFHQD